MLKFYEYANNSVTIQLLRFDVTSLRLKSKWSDIKTPNNSLFGA